MNNPTVLMAKDLMKSYPQAEGDALTILDHFSCDIKAGEIVALVGPSGSGKSTLLHALGLLDQVDSGVIQISGKDVQSLGEVDRTRLRRSDIGFIYQFHHLLPEFSALENIMLPQIIAGISQEKAKTRAETLLQRLKLLHRSDHRPAKLSGGEQQRVAIARAMANKPKVLLADEPTGNLDPETAEEVFQLFIEVTRKAKIGALIATHNMELAKRMDRIIRF